ncbi:TPA: SGNH/GDSL hydrolase family protein [Clostridium perfringens]|nr:SGNH/GDSL hydrolase family protein [Clostridium perfringens]
MKEIIVNVDNYNENSIKTIEGDNLSEVYKIYICKNKRRVNLTNKIAVMAYVDEYSSKRSNILNLNITNAAEGEIELPITNVISRENGVYACEIAIYGENNSLEQTAPFSLIVENNIFSKISNVAINTTDFQILSEAIKTTSEYAEKLKEGTENIELQYAYKLNEKMNKDDVLSMANMGQDVKEAMTGGSVAVVGKNAILTQNIVDDQVTVNKVDFLKKSSNLYDYKKDLISKSIYSDGTLIHNEGVNTSDYIYVNSNCDYSFTGFSRYAIYDDSKNFISLSNVNINAANTINTGKNGGFIRLHYEKINKNKRQFNKGKNLLGYEEFYIELGDDIGIEKFEQEINEKYENANKITYELINNMISAKNLLNKETVILNHIINSNGTPVDGYNDWYYSDKIYVKPNTKYTVRFCPSNGGAEYDVDGNFIKKISANNIDNYTFTTDKNTFFIRVNGQKAYLNTDMVVEGEEYPSDYVPYEVKIKDDLIKNSIKNLLNDLMRKSNILYGKKIASAGDSITHGLNPNGGLFKNYAELMAERNGMKFYNYGISGSTMSNVPGKNPFCVDRYLNMETDLDYLTIWFGWNDHAYSTLGSIDDTDDKTFYGAWNKVLPALIKKYPTCKIGLIVPYGCDEGFRQAVRDIGAKYGIPCLDLEDKNVPLIHLRKGVDNDIQLFRRKTFTHDTTHLNQEGYNYMSTFYEHFIKSL